MSVNDNKIGLSVTPEMTSAGFLDIRDFSFQLLLGQGSSGSKGTDSNYYVIARILPNQIG